MSLSTIAAARQNEMKVSMAVVATITLGTGWAEPCVFVMEASSAMSFPKPQTCWSYHFARRIRLPPDCGGEFPRVLKLSEWNFKQDAEVSSLSKAIETLMENFPSPCKEMNCR